MAMSAGGGGGGGLTNEINVTPLIVVLLVLLIIFMMAVPMLRKAVDLQLPVPNTQPVTTTTPPDQIVLQIAADGSYKINSQPVPATPNGLADEIKKIYTGRPDKVLFVKADGKLKYQAVIKAISVVRGAGVLVIGIPPADNSAQGGAAATGD
jgi:biopolymer transport protein ExbD